MGTQSEHWDGSWITHLLSRLPLCQMSEASRCACAQITCSRTRPCTHLRAVVGWRRPSHWRTHPPTHKGRRSTTTHDTQTAQLFGVIFFLRFRARSLMRKISHTSSYISSNVGNNSSLVPSTNKHRATQLNNRAALSQVRGAFYSELVTALHSPACL